MIVSLFILVNYFSHHKYICLEFRVVKYLITSISNNHGLNTKLHKSFHQRVQRPYHYSHLTHVRLWR